MSGGDVLATQALIVKGQGGACKKSGITGRVWHNQSGVTPIAENGSSWDANGKSTSSTLLSREFKWLCSSIMFLT